MHGKPTLGKALRKVRRAEVKNAYKTKNYLELGSWRLEEDSNGDLIAMNLENGKTVILISKEED